AHWAVIACEVDDERAGAERIAVVYRYARHLVRRFERPKAVRVERWLRCNRRPFAAAAHPERVVALLIRALDRDPSTVGAGRIAHGHARERRHERLNREVADVECRARRLSAH